MNMLAQWEDEENQRQVQFSIDYSIEGTKLIVHKITPVKVTIVCPESNTVTKTMGVHTDKGKLHLREKFEASGKLNQLLIALGNKHGLLLPVE